MRTYPVGCYRKCWSFVARPRPPAIGSRRYHRAFASGGPGLRSRSLGCFCHNTAQQNLASTERMGRTGKRPSPATQQLPAWATPPPSQLHALTLTLDGSVSLPDGTAILEAVSPLTYVAKETARVPDQMLVLGATAADGPDSHSDIVLGNLRCQRWLACARNKLWWMTPEWGTKASELPPETQFLLLEREGGQGYGIILPLIDGNTFRGTLRPPRNGKDSPDAIILRMESGDEAVLGSKWTHAVLMAAGPDPYALVEAAVAEAARLSGGAKPLREKRLPPSIDVFGWCSWDAYYSSVSASGLVDAVASLAAGGTPPGLVIIDDGWQQTDLDPEMKAPKDPAAALSALRGDLPGSQAAALARESYIEGESEAISAILREIPAGTATGMMLQEVKAAEDVMCEVDYAALARQHDAATAAVEQRRMRALRAIESATELRRRSGRRNLVLRLTGTLMQYIVGLIVGGFQALLILFYQWIVDPAADGTWPVRFFAYLTSGPLRAPMLQFYADQTNFTRRLVEVRANSKFHSPDATPEAVHSGKPEDLGSVIAHLKSEMNVRFVYCWHGLSAYWCGVSPESTAMQQYKPRLVFAKPSTSLREIEPSMLWNPAVLGGVGAIYDPKTLFYDMHSYLASCGVAGVKVDCQAGVGMVGSVTGGGPAVAARYHAALEDSVAKHFPKNDAINCMCHSTENIYRWRDTAIARASDDFYPTDTASHLPHIAACAFNGLFLSALALPDFDMFHSNHRAADIHAAARAVSGGPVYISDAPGTHAFELLRQLVLPDGQILRCLLPARPTKDCLFLDVMRDGRSLLKLWNVNRTSGVVGVFHLQGSSWDRARRRFAFHNGSPPPLTVRVKPSDVEAFAAHALPQHGSKAGGGGAAGSVEHALDALCKSTAKGGVVSVGAGAGVDEISLQENGFRSEESPTPSEASTTERWVPPREREGNGNGWNVVDDNSNNKTSSSKYNGNFGPAAGDVSNFKSTNGGGEPSGYDSDVSSEGDVSCAGTNGGANHRKPNHNRSWSGTNGNGGAHAAGQGSGSGLEFAAYVNATGTLCRVGMNDGIDVTLQTLQAAIVTFTPIHSAAENLQFAPIGLKNMLNCGGAVTAMLLEDRTRGEEDAAGENGGAATLPDTKVTVSMDVKGRGTLLALSSRRPARCLLENRETAFEWASDEEKLEIEVPQMGASTHQKLVVEYD